MSIEHFTSDAQEFLNDLNNWPAKANCAVQNNDGSVHFGVTGVDLVKSGGGWLNGAWQYSIQKKFPPAEVWGDAQVLKTDIVAPQQDHQTLQYFSLEAQGYISNPNNWPDKATGAVQTSVGRLSFYDNENTPTNDASGWTVKGGNWLHHERYQCADTPLAWKKAIITKAELFQMVEPGNKLLAGFSDKAQVFLLDEKNWPKGSVGVCQDSHQCGGQLNFLDGDVRNVNKDSEEWLGPTEDGNKYDITKYIPVGFDDMPDDDSWEKAMVVKDQLFPPKVESLYPTKVGPFYFKCIEHFSEDAKAFINDQDNWPKGAVGVVQGCTGLVYFFSQSMNLADVGDHWSSPREDEFFGRGPAIRCNDPYNWKKAKVLKFDLFGIQIGEPQSEKKGGAIEGWISPNPLLHQHMAQGESDKLPTLITNGHWVPFHFPVTYEVGSNKEEFSLEFSGLKDRSISPQRMRELLMSSFGYDRIKATVMHNKGLLNVGLYVGDQHYNWVGACTK